ncbi:MAG: hypothetical protein HQK49_05385 [Oligoflexia bacterium]|nr:hypothetical protein [Oligoflexia bacterium]
MQIKQAQIKYMNVGLYIYLLSIFLINYLSITSSMANKVAILNNVEWDSNCNLKNLETALDMIEKNKDYTDIVISMNFSSEKKCNTEDMIADIHDWIVKTKNDRKINAHIMLGDVDNKYRNIIEKHFNKDMILKESNGIYNITIDGKNLNILKGMNEQRFFKQDNDTKKIFLSPGSIGYHDGFDKSLAIYDTKEDEIIFYNLPLSIDKNDKLEDFKINVKRTNSSPTFGGELTFSRENIETNNHISINKVIENVANELKKINVNNSFIIQIETTKEKTSKRNFYKVNIKKANDNNFPDLSFTVGIDGTSIEITHSPLTLKQMQNQEIKMFFDKLFEATENEGYIPSKTGKGGGHIHIGVYESFSEKPWASLCFISELYRHSHIFRCALKNKIKEQSHIINKDQILKVLEVNKKCLIKYKNSPHNIILRGSKKHNCFEKIMESKKTGYKVESNIAFAPGPRMKGQEDSLLIGKNLGINLTGAAGYTLYPTIEIRAIDPEKNYLASLSLYSLFNNAITYSKNKCQNIEESINHITLLEKEIKDSYKNVRPYKEDINNVAKKFNQDHIGGEDYSIGNTVDKKKSRECDDYEVAIATIEAIAFADKIGVREFTIKNSLATKANKMFDFFFDKKNKCLINSNYSTNSTNTFQKNSTTLEFEPNLIEIIKNMHTNKKQ